VGTVRAAILILTIGTAFIGCESGKPRYTSEDVALLPCERPDERMFYPVELLPSTYFFPVSQYEALKEALVTEQIDHIIVFVHGWNKTAAVAEHEYGDFVCRLYAAARERTRRERTIIVGVFWRSTLSINEPDPMLLKPFTYYVIRDRADAVARVGFVSLLRMFGYQLDKRFRDSPGGSRPSLHLVGHSFGGRILVRSTQQFLADGVSAPNDPAPRPIQLARSISRLNIALLNAAIAPSQLDADQASGAVRLRDRTSWLPSDPAGTDWRVVLEKREAAITLLKEQAGGRATYMVTDAYGGQFFNLYSRQDTATGRLFPMASIFSNDPMECAVGACPIRGYDRIVVCGDGRLRTPVAPLSHGKGPFNVDVSGLVLDHTDIFKGRVAIVVADVLFGPTRRDLHVYEKNAQRQRGCPENEGVSPDRARE